MKNLLQLLKRIAKISGIVIVSLLALLFIAPYLFPDTVSRKIKSWANQSITGRLDFDKARLSFFHHFPSLTLTLSDVALTGSAPFARDTLLAADKLSFGINLQKLVFGGSVNVTKFYLEHALVNIEVNEKGEANYNIYKSKPKKDSAKTDTSSASLRLEKIVISDTRLLYHDQSIPMRIDAEHFNYEGTGDLSQSIFDLTSHIRADSLSFVLNGEPYVTRKAIDADLVTQVNTSHLALLFQKNDLQINKLNLQFSGKMDFLSNGYDIRFDLRSKDADLYQLITAFPPDYIAWLQKTQVKGTIDLHTSLQGKYIASAGRKPDFTLQFALRDGYIAYNNSKTPLSDLAARAAVTVPGLDPEKMDLALDSLSFRVAGGFFRMNGRSHGLTSPRVDVTAAARMDLDNLQKALGFSDLDCRGQLELDATAKGLFARKIESVSMRKKDTVIASVPVFHMHAALRNGYVHYRKVPEPVSKLVFAINADCPDSDYTHASLRLDSLLAVAGKNHLSGKAQVNAAKDFPLDGLLDGFIDLGEIRRFYPLDSVDLRGQLTLKIQTSGKYAPARHLFPKTTGTFRLDNGYIQTKYYPHPVEALSIHADAVDNTGTLNDLDLRIDPATLRFEDKPFTIRAKFNHFDDLAYELSLAGELDLERIYRVFAVSGVDLTGLIRVNASFRGKQSDAVHKRYERLDNKGTLEVQNMRVRHEYFPKPFIIPQGSFHFDRDKMWFDRFFARYGSSDFRLDGYLQNAINYALSGTKTLTGQFNLTSNLTNVDEFTAFSSQKKSSPIPITADSAAIKPPPATNAGVVMIPQDLDLTLKADIRKIAYSGISLDSFSGGVSVAKGSISLLQTGFSLIGARIGMSGKYTPVSPQKALFEYHLQASDFDVKRAYNEITLFHDLVTSAANAEGVISLDYSLSGTLNDSMRPVYPTLVGGGTLSVKKVKFKGWKLMNTVGSSTGKGDLKDPDLSKIDLKSSIKDNIITIPKMKFKTGLFRIRFEGQTSFENLIRFKMRVGLPPLGILGIPLHVSGTSDHPKIGLGRQDTDTLGVKDEQDSLGK